MNIHPDVALDVPDEAFVDCKSKKCMREWMSMGINEGIGDEF